MRRARSKKELEIVLQGLEKVPNPVVELEQYATQPNLAAEVLYTSWLRGEVEGMKIADLGCGSGTFAVGASLLGAKEAVGIDVSPIAIVTSWRNASRLRLWNLRFHVSDVLDFQEEVDTVFQNPPFGVQRRHADLAFLEKALSVATVVYSVHKSGNVAFMRKAAAKSGAKITHILEREILIPRLFDFHRKDRRQIKVDIYRFLRGAA